MMIETTELNFKEDIAHGYSVVDFWAPWCGPCKMLTPILEELSNELTDFNFYKINVDENANLANSQNISSVPTVNIYKNGKKIASQTGAKPKVLMKKFILENMDMV